MELIIPFFCFIKWPQITWEKQRSYPCHVQSWAYLWKYTSPIVFPSGKRKCWSVSSSDLHRPSLPFTGLTSNVSYPPENHISGLSMVWSVYHIKDARPNTREILDNWLGFLLVHSGSKPKIGNSGAVCVNQELKTESKLCFLKGTTSWCLISQVQPNIYQCIIKDATQEWPNGRHALC